MFRRGSHMVVVLGDTQTSRFFSPCPAIFWKRRFFLETKSSTQTKRPMFFPFSREHPQNVNIARPSSQCSPVLAAQSRGASMRYLLPCFRAPPLNVSDESMFPVQEPRPEKRQTAAEVALGFFRNDECIECLNHPSKKPTATLSSSEISPRPSGVSRIAKQMTEIENLAVISNRLRHRIHVAARSNCPRAKKSGLDQPLRRFSPNRVSRPGHRRALPLKPNTLAAAWAVPPESLLAADTGATATPTMPKPKKHHGASIFQSSQKSHETVFL